MVATNDVVSEQEKQLGLGSAPNLVPNSPVGNNGE